MTFLVAVKLSARIMTNVANLEVAVRRCPANTTSFDVVTNADRPDVWVLMKIAKLVRMCVASV